MGGVSSRSAFSSKLKKRRGMGSWDAGNFENDTAMDWVGDLRESRSVTIVRDALIRVIEQSAPQRPSFVGRLLGRHPAEPYLPASVASEALAAAEIVACWLGHPLPELPDGVVEWTREHAQEFSPDSGQFARQAVAIIKTKSELKDLWEEGDASIGFKWHAVIADLERRLQS